MLAKKYHLHWIAGRASILSKYITYILFNIGHSFCGTFSILFPNASASCGKKFWAYFYYIFHLLVWAQKVCLSDFENLLKILFQTGDNVLRCFFCSIYVQIKSSFSDEKEHQQWNLRHTLVETLLKINVAKY